MCEEYFWIPHRNEARGVGGIFFDDMNCNNDLEKAFSFVQSCGNSFMESYIPIVEKRNSMPFTPEMKTWQQLRRGRYVDRNGWF